MQSQQLQAELLEQLRVLSSLYVRVGQDVPSESDTSGVIAGVKGASSIRHEEAIELIWHQRWREAESFLCELKFIEARRCLSVANHDGFARALDSIDHPQGGCLHDSADFVGRKFHDQLAEALERVHVSQRRRGTLTSNRDLSRLKADADL
jgi:hypothetical protein